MQGFNGLILESYMSLSSLLSPSRTVLHVSDEAMYIYSVSAKEARLVDSLPWNTPDFVKSVSNIIANKCGKKPLLILNDMVEQHYRKEKVVKTKGGMLDKSSIVNRKLTSAFPNYPVKAAYQLKEKIAATPSQLGADVYIFAAVPDTDQFHKTIDASTKSLASLSALCLLPIESSDMIKALSERFAKYKKDTPKWSVFIGQHKNGGLRQIVTKNGELALTRMSPIVDSDADPEKWASDVHHEFQATVSYLSRFDYGVDDKLLVNVIANPDAGARLQLKLQETDAKIMPNIMTATEAAAALNLSIGPQEDERYADILHIAWVGKKSKFILPMRATEVDAVSRPRQIALAASIALVLSGGFLSYQLFTELQKITTTTSDIELAQNRKAQLQVQYQKEVERKEALGFDVRLVQSSMDVYNALEKSKLDIISLARGVGNGKGKDLRFSEVSVTPFSSQNPRNVVARFLNTSGQPVKIPLYNTTLKLKYPSTTDIQRGNQEVEELAKRLQTGLPDYEVSVSKLLKDYEYTEGLVVEAGKADKKDLTQDFIAEISVSGPLIEQEQPAQ